ncbi:hypothetical protein [Devosia sediminis]|uniref:Uncharacterized protein n=1 Tax=Devosia sediminis TaxID=2798801 RepID=A0A934MPJ7_9HYPH|nr:hypothetical protein [Devosia sediminis]MBJ3783394.1 hypothetical protein [Devosia sediminis]
MMAGLPDFRARQLDLQKRLDRQRPRTMLRRRLERELRGLIAAELQLEIKAAAAPEGHAPAQIVEPRATQATHWLRRWENQQDNDR